MGIANFTKWIKETFPGAFTLYTKRMQYDYIYIDMNYIFHSALYGCVSKGEFLNKIKYSIKEIMKKYIVTKELVLAIDGPSSYSKLLLQKERRQMSVDYCDNELNSIYLTPGTSLMFDILKDLEIYSKTIFSDYLYLKPKVKILSFMDNDEGEIKMYRELYKNASTYPRSSHLIIGIDSDLFLLAFNARPFVNIDIAMRKKFTTTIFSLESFLDALKLKTKRVSMTNNSYRSEFTFVCLLLGNDYFPKIKGIGVKKLFYAYFNYCKYNNHHPAIINMAGNINFNSMNMFLSYVNMYTPAKYKPKENIKDIYDIVPHYLESILWCLDMYSDGVCKKYDHYYLNGNDGPTATDIQIYTMMTNNKPVLIPRSNEKPYDYRIYSIILLPRDLRINYKPEIEKIIEEDFKALYAYDQCVICKNNKKELSRNKVSRDDIMKIIKDANVKIRSPNFDLKTKSNNENTKEKNKKKLKIIDKDIKKFTDNITKHRKKHQYVLTAKEIVTISNRLKEVL